MPMLDGKVAVVTGAGRGIGRGIAHLLAKEGASVVVNDLGSTLSGEGTDLSVAQQVVNEIEAAGGKAAANTDSVTDFAATGRMIDQAIDTFGKLDILVNVAGILRDRMIFNMAPEEWQAVLDVHLKGTFNTCHWASVYFHDTKAGGRIINMSSNSAFGAPGQPNYAAAKAGLIQLTRTAAVEVARRGVTINAVAPGWIETEMTADVRGELLDAVPAKRAGTVGEVAACVRFLMSEQASYVTGAVLSVDGGLGA